MGRYYIAAAGHGEEVAAAAEEHYAPQGPSDGVPEAPVSVAVALADKIDLLTGFWAIDEKPTGSRDPFALRRTALGVIRLMLENDLSLGLKAVFESASDRHYEYHHDNMMDVVYEIDERTARALGIGIRDLPIAVDLIRENLPRREIRTKLFEKLLDTLVSDIPDPDEELLSFIHDRLKVYLRDRGIRHDVIDACIETPGNDDLTLLVARARALQEVLGTEDGENLLQGFKRANNILTQAEEKDGVEYSYGADVKFAEMAEEQALFAALEKAEPRIGKALEAGEFTTAMAAMAALRGPIDGFFEAVQVNDDNQTLRRNRLNLLSQIRGVCSKVADLTRIDG
jgi:glycyl-tRNA synthetase beta chain